MEVVCMAVLDNSKHEHFALLVAKGVSATKAYTSAGYSDKGAKQSAARLLTKSRAEIRAASSLGAWAHRLSDSRRHGRVVPGSRVLCSRGAVPRSRPATAAANDALRPLCRPERFCPTPTGCRFARAHSFSVPARFGPVHRRAHSSARESKCQPLWRSTDRLSTLPAASPRARQLATQLTLTASSARCSWTYSSSS